MSPAAKREYLEKIRARYRGAEKGVKKGILDEFCEVCGYARKYAIRVLNRKRLLGRKKPGPERTYGAEELRVLKGIWLSAGQMCSKRLKAALPLWLPYYEEKHGKLPKRVREKVLAVSPATMDRLLGPTRARHPRKGLCGTRPGTLLRNQIPLKTDHWDVSRPGYLEADTVAHCGNSMAGNFIWTLTFTDILTGWTENRAIWNKGSEGVVRQVKRVEAILAFPLLGFDCDNGSEFLNHHLLRYFQERKKPVSFTRSRPYKKNDNAHVEQKQWTHVRQLFGYERFQQPELVDVMNNLYENEWSLLQNFFCPTFKLEKKERINSKYRKTYEPPKTPCQRLLDSPHVKPEAKKRLRETLKTLNPLDLNEGVERKLEAFFNRHRKASSWVKPSPALDDPYGVLFP